MTAVHLPPSQLLLYIIYLFIILEGITHTIKQNTQ